MRPRKENPMSRIISHLLNGAVVIGVLALTIAHASAAPAVKHYDGFSCVRAHYDVVYGYLGNPKPVRVFSGFVPCRESYATDKNGFMAFPEA